MTGAALEPEALLPAAGVRAMRGVRNVRTKVSRDVSPYVTRGGVRGRGPSRRATGTPGPGQRRCSERRSGERPELADRRREVVQGVLVERVLDFRAVFAWLRAADPASRR